MLTVHRYVSNTGFSNFTYWRETAGIVVDIDCHTEVLKKEVDLSPLEHKEVVPFEEPCHWLAERIGLLDLVQRDCTAHDHCCLSCRSRTKNRQDKQISLYGHII